MSLMAGVVQRQPGAAPLDEIARQLRGAISRSQDSRVEVLRGAGYCFLKCDFGAFGAPGIYQSEDGAVSLLCGESLLLGTASANRLADLKLLHRAAATEDEGMLRGSCGTFAFAHFDPRRFTLTLATDKIGLRPMYFWVNRDYVVFASTLRVLESVRQIPKGIDVQGVTEEVAFGFPLGDRTAYSGCKLLRSGEVLVASPKGVRRSLYARWDDVRLSDQNQEERAALVHEAFGRAVQRRLGDERVSLAFLTGGLDSRCIVSALRERGASVHSFCFGVDASQDVIFSEQFAKAIGSVHQRVPIPATPGTASFPAPEKLPLDVPRTQKIWAGDGGSVGLGHVYLTPAMIDRMRAADVSGAVAAFIEHNHIRVPARLLAKGMPKPAELIRAAISEELSSIQCEDPARALFVFLLHNDQRRHLSKHFESLDLHQWEVQLPFFDSEVLREIIATPIDWCLGHGLYHHVLRCFGPVTTAVPWQAYPGHEPCPLPVPRDLVYQWRDHEKSARNQAVRRELLANARRMLRLADFPTDFLDRGGVRAAYWLTRLRLRDYQYALGTAEVYERRWRTSKRNDSGGDQSLLARPGSSPAVNQA